MSNEHRKGLIAAYRKLMAPLVRVLLKNGVSYYEFAEVLKNVFVEEARNDVRAAERYSSHARVAILTGLTRKEVEKQRFTSERGDLAETSNLNKVTRLLEGWHTDPQYTGAYGLPIELLFENTASTASFTSLVKQYCGDLAPKEMLEELIAIGAVERLASGHLRVLVRAYIPQSLHPDALARLGNVVSNFVTTYEHNMAQNVKASKRFERVVYADHGLQVDLMPAFDRLIRAKGQQLLVELDNWLSAQEPSSIPDDNAEYVKTGVGIYHFVESD